MIRSALAWHARAARYASLLGGVLLAFVCCAALADPPARVARLSFVAGHVSFSPAADPDSWVEAPLNRPVFIGDRVWSDRGSRVELELGTAAIRGGEFTNVTVLNLDDRVTQLELTGGRIDVRVRSLASDETFEIDTPNVAFAITRLGNYRIEVDADGNSTVVAIRDGRGEVYGEGNSYVIDRGQWYRFYGTALENDYARIPPVDDLDRWALSREARHDRSMSARYVSHAVIGYDDLDDYGTWTTVPDYGNVWMPRSVGADWAPYRDGHWAWIEPWGWTWVDDAPWGFAPFHYGRWAFVNARWCWVPGPVNVRPIYAPALVAFAGGNDLTINVSSGSVRGVAWFPLAPGEVYRPPYRVTRNYFTEINVTNTRVNNAVVTNIYGNPNAVREMHYRYRAVPDAVTAVAVNAFVESRPVARAALPRTVVADVVQRAPVLPAPSVAPARVSVIGAARPAQIRPPAPVAERHVVARAVPPAAPPTYAPHELNVNAGNVVDANPRHPALPLRDRVRVVAPAQPMLSGATAQHRGAGNPAANAAAPASAPANAATPPRPAVNPGSPPPPQPAAAPAENGATPTPPPRRGPHANAPTTMPMNGARANAAPPEINANAAADPSARRNRRAETAPETTARGHDARAMRDARPPVAAVVTPAPSPLPAAEPARTARPEVARARVQAPAPQASPAQAPAPQASPPTRRGPPAERASPSAVPRAAAPSVATPAQATPPLAAPASQPAVEHARGGPPGKSAPNGSAGAPARPAADDSAEHEKGKHGNDGNRGRGHEH